MKLLVPEIGTILTLSKNWTFKLHAERRNEKFVEQFDYLMSDPALADHKDKVEKSLVESPREGVTYHPFGFQWEESHNWSWDFTIKKGSRLKVDRVYIRRGISDYSSITFFLDHAEKMILANPKRKPRFWAKLADVNEMHIVAPK